MNSTQVWRRARGWASHHPRLVITIATAVVLLPGIIALITLLGRRWLPAGDMAQAELHVRGLWSNPPLVGAAGRIESNTGLQGSHPGPSLWVAMYPIYALFGSTSHSLLAAALSVHLVACWLTLWLATKRGGLQLMLLVAAGLAVIVRASGPGFATEPWNPWLAVIPFAAFLLACWHAACGARWWYVAAVALGSHCIQCHVGYIPLVPAAIVSAAAADVWRTRRAPTTGKRFPWRVLGASFAVGVACWIPPLIDQWRRQPGNLTILAEHFLAPRQAFVGIGVAIRVVASELGPFGPWMTGPMLLSRLPILVLVTAVGWWWAIRRALRSGRDDLVVGHVLLAGVSVAGAWSVTRIFGGFQEYTIRWFWVLAALIAALIAWTAVSTSARRSVRRAILGAAGVAALVATTLGAVQFPARAELSGFKDSEQLAQLSPGVAAGLDPSGRYLLRWYDPVGLGAIGYGLVLEMERAGRDVRVDPWNAAGALPHRTIVAEQATGLLYLVLGSAINDFRAAGYPQLAYSDIRTPQQQARFDELDEQLPRRLREIGRNDLADSLNRPGGSAGLLFINPPLPADIAAMVAEYVGLRLPAAVFLLPPGATPPVS